MPYHKLLFTVFQFFSLVAAAQNDQPKWYSYKNLSGGIETNNQYYFENKKSGIVLPSKRFASAIAASASATTLAA